MQPRNYLAHRLFRFCFLLVVVPMFIPIAGFGQTREKQTESDHTVICTTYLISINVEVEDESGHPISDLNKDQFAIYEDGVEQSIESLQRQDVEIGKTRVRYTLSYFPTNDKEDGTFRLIQVRVLTENNNKVKGIYWPIGYFAKRQ